MYLNFLKTLSLLVIVGLISVQNSFAQTEKQSVKIDSGKNLIKLNLGSFLFKSVAVQYEHAIGKKTSIGIGLRTMPESNLPFASSFNNDQKFLQSLLLSNFAITPEVKFYMGKGVFKGFYVAPFLRYAKYDASGVLDFTVQNVEESIPLKGSLNTYTAGVLIGAQWRIAKNVYFDWSIFGPQYGFSDGDISGKKSLTLQEQDELRKEIEKLENDMPIGKFSHTINGEGVKVDIKGPWAGIRANFGIGYRF